MWLELKMVLVFIIVIANDDDNMSIEDWFDESGKDRVSLTTCEEDAGFQC